MKKVFLFLISVAICHSAIGQISTGDVTSTKLRTGNRAQEGNFGLYIGGAVDFSNTEDFDNTSIRFLPLVNLKYMLSDKMELRLGLSMSRHSNNVDGTIENILTNETEKLQDKAVEAKFSLSPGFAYHFSKSNILDVYVGAELPLGYDRMNIAHRFGEGYNITQRSSFNIGVGGFIGLQAYIANLPLAIGLEYGFYGRFNLGMQYKNEFKANASSDAQITYSTAQTGPFIYKSLTARNGNIGNQIRLTLTYFFNK